ncbi:MAG: hypothetical protein RBT49_03440 [Bacteroidales bacterium]|jgi:hypothetical protein|nr:hypothetical protein [Bacteroidales bacterium]
MTTEQQRNDEIDLIELFQKMGTGIKNMFNKLIGLINSFFIFLIRKSVWLITFIILGFIVSYMLFTMTKRYYTSEMTARSNSMNNTVIVNSINLLNDLFISTNYSALSEYLQLTETQAKNIKSINAYYGIDINKDGIADFVDYKNSYNPKDTTQKRLGNVFYLQISVFDESVFPILKNSIKSYINNNPFVIENNNLRINQAENQIAILRAEIAKLDSLQNVQYFEIPKTQKSNNNQMIVLNEKDIKLFHEDKIKLNTKILELEKDLAINPDPITVIQDFAQLSKTQNPITKFIKIWVPIFFVLGLICALLWQYRKKIWFLISEKQY